MTLESPAGALTLGYFRTLHKTIPLTSGTDCANLRLHNYAYGKLHDPDDLYSAKQYYFYISHGPKTHLTARLSYSLLSTHECFRFVSMLSNFISSSFLASLSILLGIFNTKVHTTRH